MVGHLGRHRIAPLPDWRRVAAWSSLISVKTSQMLNGKLTPHNNASRVEWMRNIRD
jgi:hypothetical protein